MTNDFEPFDLATLFAPGTPIAMHMITLPTICASDNVLPDPTTPYTKASNFAVCHPQDIIDSDLPGPVSTPPRR